MMSKEEVVLILVTKQRRRTAARSTFRRASAKQCWLSGIILYIARLTFKKNNIRNK